MRFPRPVLWSNTDDYASGTFSAPDIKVAERLDTGEVRLTCSLTVSQPEIRDLLTRGQAQAGVFVTCLDTYYNELQPLPPDGGMVRIAEGKLKGRVTLRPVIWSRAPVSDFKSASLHAEFGDGGIDFPQATILALADEVVISVGREKLAPIESIFQLCRNDDVPPDQIALQLDGETIDIMACEATYKKIHSMRGSYPGRAVLLNSIYLPAVMNVLGVLREDGVQYEDRRWKRIFMARLDHLGIDVASAEPLESAQRVLVSPFGKIVADVQAL
jgi:hypothetical protein